MRRMIVVSRFGSFRVHNRVRAIGGFVGPQVLYAILCDVTNKKLLKVSGLKKSKTLSQIESRYSCHCCEMLV